MRRQDQEKRVRAGGGHEKRLSFSLARFPRPIVSRSFAYNCAAGSVLAHARGSSKDDLDQQPIMVGSC